LAPAIDGKLKIILKNSDCQRKPMKGIPKLILNSNVHIHHH
jgi:hypothetical protein